MNIHKAIQSAHKYHQAGNLDQAEVLCKKILKKQPKHFDALHLLGFIYYQSKDFNSAISYLQKAIHINSADAVAYNNLGNALQNNGQIDEAIACYNNAVQINPYYDEAYNNLGCAFYEKGNFDEAIANFKKTLQINPYNTLAHNNLGQSLLEKVQIHEALLCFQKAIQLKPDYALAHFNKSLALLLSGDFKEGLKEYQWRWKLEEHKMRNFSRPLWNGSFIKNATILLHTEQGLGDTIQFIRYAPMVAAKGAKVIAECQKELATLLQSIEGIHQIVIQGEELPAFDVHCPLLSLPLVLNTTLENIPAKTPYINADPLLIQKWRERVRDDNGVVKVGIAWAGGPRHKKDRYRSCSLEVFSPLAQLDDITCYSLQKGDAAQQAKNPPEGIKLIDYMEEIKDFSDTAALIENLDLVISVDTAVAHLAGALGKPVWTLLPYAADWRWLLDREDSPWYPTMRLFRQPSLDNWMPVMDRLISELRRCP